MLYFEYLLVDLFQESQDAYLIRFYDKIFRIFNFYSDIFQAMLWFTMYSVSLTSLGTPLKFFHYDFDYFDVCLNPTEP